MTPLPIDIEKAIRCLGSEAVFRATVKCFLKETDHMMTALEAAVVAGDMRLVQEKAHCVKGGLAYLHAGPSAVAASALQLAADADCPSVKSAYDRLKQEVDKLKEALSAKGPLVEEG